MMSYFNKNFSGIFCIVFSFAISSVAWTQDGVSNWDLAGSIWKIGPHLKVRLKEKDLWFHKNADHSLSITFDNDNIVCFVERYDTSKAIHFSEVNLHDLILINYPTLEKKSSGRLAIRFHFEVLSESEKNIFKSIVCRKEGYEEDPKLASLKIENSLKTVKDFLNIFDVVEDSDNNIPGSFSNKSLSPSKNSRN